MISYEFSFFQHFSNHNRLVLKFFFLQLKILICPFVSQSVKQLSNYYDQLMFKILTLYQTVVMAAVHLKNVLKCLSIQKAKFITTALNFYKKQIVQRIFRMNGILNSKDNHTFLKAQPILVTPWFGFITTKIFSVSKTTGKYDLVDIWRIRNQTSNRFTFRQKHSSEFIQRRLNYIFVSNSFQDSIKKQMFYLSFAAVICQSYLFPKTSRLLL